jgi:hypothetical protein
MGKHYRPIRRARRPRIEQIAVVLLRQADGGTPATVVRQDDRLGHETRPLGGQLNSLKRLSRRELPQTRADTPQPWP